MPNLKKKEMAKIVPAILVHDLDSFQQRIRQIENLVEEIHIDIIDGRFVPNKTVSLEQIGSIDCQAKKGAHLMTFAPEQYFSKLASFSFRQVSFHYEALSIGEFLPETIATAQSYSLKVSLAINPKTELPEIDAFADQLEFLHIMTVDPGFGGQTAKLDLCQKIVQSKDRYPKLPIAVDGGINVENIGQFAQSGAEIFFVGSAIFLGDPAANLARLNQVLAS